MDMDIPPVIPAQPTRFMDKLRSFIRMRGLAYATEKTYVFWIKRFIRFHGRKHPETMGSEDVEAFLSHLALQANAYQNGSEKFPHGDSLCGDSQTRK